MKKKDLYFEKKEDTKFFRIYEILWQKNIIHLNEYDNLDEYKFITFDILDCNLNELNDNELSVKIQKIFKHWLGYKIKYNSEDFLNIAHEINSRIKK